jgi:antitoxin MazE6
MKTAVSLPEDIFAEAERLARRLRKTRSALYRDAIADYLARHDPDTLTAKLDEVIERSGDERVGFVRAAARRTLERTDW